MYRKVELPSRIRANWVRNGIKSTSHASKASSFPRWSRNPYCRLSYTGIINNSRNYEIGAGSRDITDWFEIAIKCDSYQCAVWLLQQFRIDPFRAVKREDRLTAFGSGKPLMGSIRLLLNGHIRSPRNFPLFETIEENLDSSVEHEGIRFCRRYFKV